MSRPEGFVIENLLIYVVSILIVLDSVGVGVELGLHHHGGGDHLAGKYNQLIEMPSTVKLEAEKYLLAAASLPIKLDDKSIK